MSASEPRRGRSPLDLLEEGVLLLRAAPAGALAYHAAGAVPFVLGLLFFAADMGGSAFAADRCAGSALAVALLYVWMKVWQTVFCDRLKAALAGESPGPWPPRRVARAALVQAALQPTAFAALPLAALAALPFGWVFAFYQTATVLGDGNDDGVRPAARRAWAQASLWPGQNHLLLTLLALCGAAAVVNLSLVLALAPQLLRSLLGLETAFTRQGWAGFNLTLAGLVLGAAYLCVDPLVKAVYVLRCFYGESLRTGEDLKAGLRRLPARGVLLAALALAAVAAGPGRARAEAPPPAAAVSPGDLDRSIQRVLERPLYAWRLPRPEAPAEKKGVVARFLGESLKTLGRWLLKALDWAWDAVRWLRKVFGLDRKGAARPAADPGGVAGSVRWWTLVALAGAATAAAVLLLRRRQSAREEVETSILPAEPDLSDDAVRPDERPCDGWLALGRDLAARGESRLALRAFYLATLVHLADAGLLALARHKSNRDYAAELDRRSHAVPLVPEAFSENVRLLERVWYGSHPVTVEAVERFAANRETILAHGRG